MAFVVSALKQRNNRLVDWKNQGIGERRPRESAAREADGRLIGKLTGWRQGVNSNLERDGNGSARRNGAKGNATGRIGRGDTASINRDAARHKAGKGWKLVEEQYIVDCSNPAVRHIGVVGDDIADNSIGGVNR